MESAGRPAASGLSDAVILLGAGASKEAGVPTTFEMTERLVSGIGRPRSRYAQALNFVCGALIAHDAAEGKSPYAGLDVERVFAAVQLLAERRTLEVTPFVSAWHPAVDEWDRPSVPSFFDEKLVKALGDRPFDRGRDVLVGLINAVTGTGTGKAYEELAGLMIQQLRELVATTPKELGYLKPLVHAGRNAGGLTIATLNYDLAIEQLGEGENVPVHTGIEQWTSRGKWSWPKEGIRLLKLHGSIDWCWRPWDRKDGELPHKTVVQSDDPFEERQEPVVVFGQRGKLRPEGPFLSLIGEFEARLAKAKRLVVIGYSFRDDHVNEVIRRWTTERKRGKVAVVDPAWPKDWRGTEFAGEMYMHLTPEGLGKSFESAP